MKRIVLAACLTAIAATANAAHWAVADLGRVDRSNHCLRAATQTFREMLGEARIATIRASDWVIYADGINGDHDAIITCTFGDNRGVRATLVIHSKERPVNAHLLKRRIEQIFIANARRIRKEWVESFN